MAKQTLLTDEGLKNYEQELEYLKTVKRKDVAEKIKVALSFGDLSENSEYDEAKNDQAMLEARIAQIESILKNAKIIDESELTNEHIHVGSTVKIHDCEFDEDSEYQIIGANEADPFNGKLSDESPVGAALLGHKAGDTVVIETPEGEVKFIILEISK
jgi:transcription elongation factor GreA